MDIEAIKKSKLIQYILELEQTKNDYDILKKHSENRDANELYFLIRWSCPKKDCDGKLFRQVSGYDTCDYQCNKCRTEYNVELIPKKGIIEQLQEVKKF